MKRFYLSSILFFALAGCTSQPEPDVIVKRDGKPDMVRSSSEDAEMNKAVKTAQQSVGKFISALKSPQAGQSNFAVKKPFPTDNGNEHIWLSELAFDGKNFRGRVNNDPVDVRNVKVGDTVTVGKTEISDWNYTDKGKLIGGYTIRVLYNRMPESEKRDFRAQTGLQF